MWNECNGLHTPDNIVILIIKCNKCRIEMIVISKSIYVQIYCNMVILCKFYNIHIACGASDQYG